MPRKHRRAPSGEMRDVSRLAHGGARIEVRRGGEWYVRDIPASRALKVYRCPECGTDIPVGQAHLVAWSAENFFGDEAAVRDRRHYHGYCWRLA